MITVTDWIVAAGTLALVLVAVVAIFQDRIRAWFWSPKLDIAVIAAPPDCHKTILRRRDAQNRDAVECYYLRFRIVNRGNQRAEQVEVFAAELSRQLADGTFRRVDSFLPMNLVWSHTGEVFAPSVSPGMYRHCDLAHIVDPSKRTLLDTEDLPSVSSRTVLSFDTVVRPYTLTSLQPPGVYHLVLLIAAANTRPVARTLEIRITGDWYSDESRMLGDGIGIRILK